MLQRKSVIGGSTSTTGFEPVTKLLEAICSTNELSLFAYHGSRRKVGLPRVELGCQSLQDCVFVSNFRVTVARKRDNCYVFSVSLEAHFKTRLRKSVIGGRASHIDSRSMVCLPITGHENIYTRGGDSGVEPEGFVSDSRVTKNS